MIDTTEKVAKDLGVPMASVALAWLLQQPGVATPVIGATKMQHIDDACRAAALELSREAVAEIEALYVPHPPASIRI